MNKKLRIEKKIVQILRLNQLTVSLFSVSAFYVFVTFDVTI